MLPQQDSGCSEENPDVSLTSGLSVQEVQSPEL